MLSLAIIYYGLAIIGFIKKKSKYVSFVMIGAMWVVFGFCTYNGDFENYRWVYNNIQNLTYWSEFEPLFNLMMYTTNILGLDFIQFRMVFSAIYLILLYFTISRYTENTSEVLGMYMVFPFLYFTSVIRSGLASVIVALAFYEITGGRERKKRFWILMVIAFLIHYTSIGFVVYYYLRNKKYENKNIFIVFGIVFGIMLLFYSGVLHSAMSLVTSNQRFLKWFVPSTQEYRFIIYLIIISLVVICFSYISKKHNDFLKKHDCEYNVYSSDIFYINIAAQAFLPTYFISNASARFIWQVMLLNIIGCAKDDEILFKNQRSSVHINVKTLYLFVLLALLFIYSNLPYANTVNDGLLVFQNNLLFS